GHVPDDPPVIHHGRDVGAHPIVTTVFSTVLYNSRPTFPGANGGPEIGERLLGHVGMSNDVLRPPQAFFQRELAAAQEGLIGVRDPAGRIRMRDDDLIVRQDVLALILAWSVRHDIPRN